MLLIRRLLLCEIAIFDRRDEEGIVFNRNEDPLTISASNNKSNNKSFISIFNLSVLDFWIGINICRDLCLLKIE